MKLMERIELNPAILVGKPIIKGTRISIEMILEELSEGNSIEDLLQNYPRLQREDILAAINYGALMLKQSLVFPASA